MKRTLCLLIAVTLGATLVRAHTEVWDGGRTIPVHRFGLNDEDNVDIVPQAQNAMPFSARTTCGICHKYETVSSGWHFNYMDTNVAPGRVGEPWVWVDTFTGTQLPLSYRGWKGMYQPQSLGIERWDFTKQFGRHFPGGGAGDPPDLFEDANARWTVSGKLEINCLGCHSGAAAQDHTEWVKQVMRENFRWAATAAGGLGDVGGMATRTKNTWLPFMGSNPDDKTFAVPPFINYDLKQFDGKNRVVFDMRKPEDRRCLICHSVTPTHAEKKDVDSDVHTRAGFKCVDCHRSGLDHKDVRGYEAEHSPFSCKECHDDGRMGAPMPHHRGIPPVHFERLACTACHSGPALGEATTRMRTARANRLNIYGRAQWFTEAPFIEETIFAKGEDGKIAPSRIMWPAFFARKAGDKVTPLAFADVSAVATNVLDHEQQVGKILKALNQDPDAGEPVFCTAGKAYKVTVDGTLVVAGKAGKDAPLWGRELEGKIVPLLADFNPADAQLPADVELKLQDLVKMLRTDDTLPEEPVMARGKKRYTRVEGVITASDSTEDAGNTTQWGWMINGKMVPMVPEFVVRSIGEVTGTDQTFTEEQLVMMLKALGKDAVYIGRGKLFSLDTAGKLAVGDNAAAEPVVWPFGHDVRPARQALGKTACTDCHTADSKFFFGKIVAGGPLKTASVAVKQQYEFEKLSAPFEKLFGWTFTFRPLFKKVLWAASTVLGLVLLAFLLAGIHRLVRIFGGHEQ